VGLLAYVRHVALLTAPPTRDTGTFSGRVWTMANKAKFRGADLEASFLVLLTGLSKGVPILAGVSRPSPGIVYAGSGTSKTKGLTIGALSPVADCVLVLQAVLRLASLPWGCLASMWADKPCSPTKTFEQKRHWVFFDFIIWIRSPLCCSLGGIVLDVTSKSQEGFLATILAS
jgi:hypothetical protein